MKILLVGATGLIGSGLVDRLRHRHHLVLGVRNPAAALARWPGIECVRVDYGDPDLGKAAAAAVTGSDAVINAAGIFHEQGSAGFDAVHVNGPRVLFQAAITQGTARLVQVSALGAGENGGARFLATKACTDRWLSSVPAITTVVRPSLVFSPRGTSTRGFAALASLPLTPLPGSGSQRVQPVHLDDLCELVERLLEHPQPPAEVPAVGPAAMTLRAYLELFKRRLGFSGRFIGIPNGVVQVLIRCIAIVPAGRVNRDAVDMLNAGSVADAAPMEALLGRAARAAERFFDAVDVAAVRNRALLAWTLPMLRASVGLLWVVTGLITLLVYPLGSSLALLERVGLHGGAALLALYAAIALNLGSGLGVFHARTRRIAYLLQIGLTLGYTLLISVFLPEYWAHPYGPLLKNIPVLAATCLLYCLDRDDGSGAG